MSPDTVISVEGLSKQYRLGQIGGTTLREDVSRWWARMRGLPDPTLKVTEANRRDRRAGDHDTAKHANGANESARSGPPDPPAAVRASRGHPSPPSSDYVWALKDVSFEVKRGEVLGIIGRNGAGKSTLLKILSRITAPTTGQVKVKGRIASLLEVGTGMHPELTGRENIYLNGAILGMTKAEITRKLDEIVAFSGVERYIDTPVKRYSSGMMVRLGFAVAAHLEPEILIVDEVLAVGDAEFQKKCLGKMQDVAGHGRTVLFVSHNMTSVGALCDRCLCLRLGRLHCEGAVDSVVSTYLDATVGRNRAVFVPPRQTDCPGSGDDAVRLLGYRALSDGEDSGLTNGTPLAFEVVVEVVRAGAYSMCLPARRAGELAFLANSYHVSDAFDFHLPGVYVARVRIPEYLLNPGSHTFGLFVADSSGARGHHVHLDEALCLEIGDDGFRRGGTDMGAWPGSVSPVLRMQTDRVLSVPEWASG